MTKPFSARRARRTWWRLRSLLWLHQEEAQLMGPSLDILLLQGA